MAEVRRDSGPEVHVYGIPGAGKTTQMAKWVGATARARGPGAVQVMSFTKTAAQEIGSRKEVRGEGGGPAIPENQIGTVHAMAYRAIGSPPVAISKVRDWNQKHSAMAMGVAGGTGKGRLDDPDFVGSDKGDDLLSETDRLRALLVPEEQWPLGVRRFHNEWTEWKKANGLVDFADMLTRALVECPTAPGRPEVVVADEAQDMTALEWALVRKWGHAAERLIVAGDPDQAQAAWARVLTYRHGWVPMRDLNPIVHRLVSYDFKGGCVAGLRNGFAFQVASHRHDGSSIRVSAGDLSTICTPEHRWWVKLDKAAATERRCVTYLMRRGDRWRVGWCQAFANATRSAHLPARARIERADAAWVLAIHDDRTSASVHESIIAAKYGLPLNTFNPVQGAQHMTTESIEAIFVGLDPTEQAERAERCLVDHGRMAEHPLWENGRDWYKNVKQVRACNLLEGYHLIPTTTGRSKESANWHPVRLSEGPRIERAYSIAVEPHRNYVVDDGIVTANCLYSFRGADVRNFLTDIPDDDKIFLDRSWRCPVKVMDLAERWVSQLTVKEEGRQYLPRDSEGVTARFPFNIASPDLVVAIKKHLDRGQSVMIAASCSYQLTPIIAALREAGVPYANPWRPTRGGWNPLGQTTARQTRASDRLLAYLVMDQGVFGDRARLWTGADVRLWSKFVKSTGVFRRGAREAIGALPGGELTYEQIEALFANVEDLEAAVEPSLAWFRDHLTAEGKKALEFPLTVTRRSGALALEDVERVFVGTIHAFKGAEADVVYLCPDLSVAQAREWDRAGEARDPLIRQFYVGATRARMELHVLAPRPGSRLAPIGDYVKV